MRTCKIAVMRHKLVEYLQRCIQRSVKYLLHAFRVLYFLHTTFYNLGIVQNLTTGKKVRFTLLHLFDFETKAQ